MTVQFQNGAASPEMIHMIRTKCVHAPIDRKADGLRVLITRSRGRGMRKTRYDAWMANLGPSEALLKSFRAEAISWAAFKRNYRRELFENGGVDRRNKTIKNHGQKFTLRLLQRLGRSQRITLMCHCDEMTEHCHRYVLRDLLTSKI
ncbi:MAG: DUF488 family protein [Micropepsaceae bacterium]